MADNEYRVLRGCNYPPNDTRANRGDVVTLPDATAEALLAIGAVEAVGAAGAPQASPGAQKRSKAASGAHSAAVAAAGGAA